MKHLTVEEMLDFVSLTELSRESITLAATVNGHTRRCEKCRKAVNAFQLIYDEFASYSAQDSFRDFISKNYTGTMESDTDELDGMDAFR